MGQVCQRHQEFYETECRYCEPTAAMPLESCDSAHARLTRLPGGGRCERCNYDILSVAFVRMTDNISANIALLHKLQVRGRVEPIPGGDVRLVEVSYANLGWPPGGVTGDGL